MTTSSSRSWETLAPSLSEWILRAVSSMGFQKMTPVQASTIPILLGAGSLGNNIGYKDVVVEVEAVTGSGKTLAFLIPAIERILRLEEPNKKHHVSAVIISPTRELAKQIYDVLVSLLGFHGPSAQALRPLEAEDASVPEDKKPLGSVEDAPASLELGPRIIPQLLVGGSTSTTENLRYFLQKSPNILIATPGRLLEILSSPHVHCTQSIFDMLIMDEADRLLDLGFKDDLQKILGRLPKQRRTGLFSASVSEALNQIIRVGLRNPVKIIVKVKHANGREEQRTPTSLQMTYLTIPASHKIPVLVQLLERLEPTPVKTIVYLSTCAGVDYYQHLLSHILSKSITPIVTVPLHGKHPPNVRNKNFSLFVNSTKPSLLLTTDIAARGLDIPQVDLVVQTDPPNDPKNFLHRAGRAGRAGRKGLSVIFLHPGREEDYISFLQIRKTPIQPLESPSISISPDKAISTTVQLRNLVKSDRALHDKAQRAFVSWVRAYSKHHAASIFRIADLDWTDLGNAWALLKLPIMPELKAWDGDRSLGESIDWTNYKYKDKAREKTRQNQHDVNQASTKQINEHQNSTQQQSDESPAKKVKSWSQHAEARRDKIKRREQRQAHTQRAREAKWSVEEREKQDDLKRMIGEVKRRKLLEEEPPFEGFGDG